ncbi:hypothetical protein NE237_020771 [Protea cynaroides]|uniref:Uncharacterized protein n=1 Tax=Protea cynaroides TaxID=273540 RepID=A0A9Q0H6K9_9MAGN|nr:hypothetical protein NE237_020771 [Protea cynaroides]
MAFSGVRGREFEDHPPPHPSFYHPKNASASIPSPSPSPDIQVFESVCCPYPIPFAPVTLHPSICSKSGFVHGFPHLVPSLGPIQLNNLDQFPPLGGLNSFSTGTNPSCKDSPGLHAWASKATLQEEECSLKSATTECQGISSTLKNGCEKGIGLAVGQEEISPDGLGRATLPHCPSLEPLESLPEMVKCCPTLIAAHPVQVEKEKVMGLGQPRRRIDKLAKSSACGSLLDTAPLVLANHFDALLRVSDDPVSSPIGDRVESLPPS